MKAERRRWVVAAAVVLAGVVGLGAAWARQGGTTRYFYDPNGRLAAVLSPTGEATLYTYDAAGNVTSITRRLATDVSVIEFSPDIGQIGASVTIYGTGFSATPGQNSVTFNGVPAAVTAAQMTELVVTVPQGATTGPIAVTTPLGTATSSRNFVVDRLPIITSFAPIGGVLDTPVTINGMNFDPTPANNQVTFNITSAVVNASTPTSIMTSVPAGATSGRIRVTTAQGTGVSNQDFRVQPPGFDPLGFFGRIAFDNSLNVTLPANRIALVVFDGTAGQRMSLHGFNVVLNNTARAFILKPDGTTLAGPAGFGTQGVFIDTLTLPMTGTYSIIVDPDGSGSGSMTLALFDVLPDVTGPITLDGLPVTVTPTTPGQNVRLTFTGVSGRRISVRITNVTVFGSQLTIIKPDGTNLFGPTGFGSPGIFTDVLTLPATGTYTVFLDPNQQHTGSMTAMLYDVPPDVLTTITPGGPPVTVTITAPGQNARATFEGATGQRISLRLTNITVFGGQVTILKPDGTNLFGPAGFSQNDFFTDVLTLTATGTHTIFLNPNQHPIGSVTLTLFDVPPDVTTPITPGGPPLTITITTPGQNARLPFNGTTGQRISLRFTNVTINGSQATILKPDGTPLVGPLFVNLSGLFIDTQTLPATGAYTIFVNPDQFHTGNATLTLHDVPPDVTGMLTIGGPPVTVTITTPGQNGLLTFNGTAGQQVTVRLTGNTMTTAGCVTVSLLRPDNTTLTSTTSCQANFNLTTQTLPTTGTYTVRIDPPQASAGSITVSVTSP